MKYAFVGFPLLTLLAACASEPEAPAEPTAEEQVAAYEAEETEREAEIASNEALSQAQAFLDELAQAGAIQVGMAQIAAENASRENVQAFADTAIDFHQEMLTGLRDLAETNDALDVSTVLSDEQRRNFAQLRGALSVDDMFIEQQRRTHREMIRRIDEFLSSESTPVPLADWAREAKPVVEDHARELAEL